VVAADRRLQWCLHPDREVVTVLGGQGQGLVGLGASASCPPKRSLPFYGLSELEGTVDPPGLYCELVEVLQVTP
jgi:hypothetical protein